MRQPKSPGQSPTAAEAGKFVGPLSALLRQLLDAGPPTCISDARGRTLFANAAYQRIAESLEATGFESGGADDGDPRGRRVSIVRDGRTEQYHRRQLVHHDEGEGDEVTATVFEPADAPESTAAALAAAVERLEDITRLVADWVWETDPDLNLTFVSPRVEEVLGYHPVELVGRPLLDLLAEPNEALGARATPAGRKPFRDIEAALANRQEKVCQFLLSGLPIYCPTSGEFLGFRGTALDVTDARSREEALRGAKETAEIASRTKGEFLANMSHELRTPLNAIIGFSELMSAELLGPIGNDQYKSYLKDIKNSAHHLLALINDILDSAKIEAGQLSLSEEIVDPAAIVESVQRLMMPRTERAGLSLRVSTAEDLPFVRADGTKLKQILLNLASNAVKFTDRGGGVEIRAENRGSQGFVFVVSDNGIGIDGDDIPRALAPFGQVDSRLHRKFEGTGLGLPMAISLTELHGGTLDLESRRGVGTTVTVRLPPERVVQDHGPGSSKRARGLPGA